MRAKAHEFEAVVIRLAVDADHSRAGPLPQLRKLHNSVVSY